MALVTVPDGAWDTSVAWSLSQPEQVVLETAANTLVLNRGRGRWIGEISFGVMKTAADAQAVKGFIDELLGSANEFDIEMRDDATITGSPAIKVVNRTTSAGKASVGITAGVTGFKRGNMIRIGDRAYRVTVDQAADRITLLPSVLPAVGENVEYDRAKMRVRLRSEPPLVYSTPDFTGPFNLQVVEAF